MTLVPTTTNGALSGVHIDHDAILRALKLNPGDANTQALLLVCDRYGLDPLLKHMVLIQGSPYVTRDGYLAVAHRSGAFDGMEVLDAGMDGTHYWAKVAVYRKDMSHPITMIGRFPKSKPMAKEYGPEMAVKCAEVAALRRAFNVTGAGAADERWDDDPAQRVAAELAAPDPSAQEWPPDPPINLPPLASDEQMAELRTRLNAISAEEKGRVAREWRDNQITPLGRPERFTVDDYRAARTLIELAEERAVDPERPFGED